jgi:citrate synthase
MGTVRTATLTFEGKSIELPVVEGSEGEMGVDITQLRNKTGLITVDPGFNSTGACNSAITYIDGDKGILRYRGIPIEDLADKSNFIEVAFLLIFEGFPVDAPPMAILSSMISTLSCFHQNLFKIDGEDTFEEAAARLISKVRTIAAYSYRMSRGLPMMYPDPNLKYIPNFLHMMFSEPYKQYNADPDIVRALDLVLVLHADHEQNCSTSTVRIVGSSKANLFASIAAGVNALWGPLHGGANVEVLEMLENIHKGRITPEEYVRLAKDKTSGVRLMGFGHRVYKNFDPRAQILKKACDSVLAKIGDNNDPLLNIARKLEELALKDNYFVERKLYPNVDFYSGIIFKAIGIPVNMFTVMFAIGRMPGWIAQWKEQAMEGDTKIARPRQIYVGPTKTAYTPVNKRP